MLVLVIGTYTIFIALWKSLWGVTQRMFDVAVLYLLGPLAISTIAMRGDSSDKDGNVVQPFMCESTTVLRYPAALDEDGYSYLYARSDYLKYQIAGLYGIMDAYTGKPITLAIYEDVRMVSSMLFEVRPANSYGVLIIDAYGDIIKE